MVFSLAEVSALAALTAKNRSWAQRMRGLDNDMVDILSSASSASHPAPSSKLLRQCLRHIALDEKVPAAPARSA